MSLEECIAEALRQNHRRGVSRFAVAMAEAQHRQALAGYWPQLNFKGGYERLEKPLDFLFPSSVIPIPSQSITVPGGTALVTIPANAFGPGFPPSTIQMPVAFPSQSVQTSSQAFRIPDQDVKVLAPDLVSGSLDLKWLLYDGGMRSGLRQESGSALNMMRQEARRTDLEIVDSVKRLYWGAVLARQLRQLGDDTLARMEVTLKLTESLYKEGSGKVTKADYLENEVICETVRAMVAHLGKNEQMAEAALANTMGLAWNESVRPAAADIPLEAYSGGLGDLVATSYRFSPDWLKLEAALSAAEGELRNQKSGYYPKIALTGELHRWWNGGYEQGFATPSNQTGWTVGVGLEIPLFNGFLTQNRVAEARARLQQLKENQILLRNGLGIQVKDLLLGLDAAVKADEATARAMKAAQDNDDLNTRAYESGLVETEKVIRAQIFNALISAQHYMARFQCVSLKSQLSLVVGTEVEKKLDGAK